MEDPRIISTQFNSPKMPYYNVLVNTQVTVEYENGKPVRLDSVVVSCQHTEEKDLKKLEAEIRKK